MEREKRGEGRYKLGGAEYLFSNVFPSSLFLSLLHVSLPIFYLSDFSLFPSLFSSLPISVCLYVAYMTIHAVVDVYVYITMIGSRIVTRGGTSWHQVAQGSTR